MRTHWLGGFVVMALLVAASAYAQEAGCPVGQPAAYRPAPSFVPTQDCRGWVPASHPLARVQPAPVPAPTLQPFAAQDIYGAIELPTTVSASAGGVTRISGWALECEHGQYPPFLTLFETKPDGSTRTIPAPPSLYTAGIPRPDVTLMAQASCPAVLVNLDRSGRNLGPGHWFGWEMVLFSPITEVGLHTLTAVWSWPGFAHAGSVSVAVSIIP